MDIELRNFYRQALKRLRRKDGKKGKPSKKELRQAQKEMIKFREFMDMGMFRKVQDAGH